jgi:lambda family phage minor tail protein L
MGTENINIEAIALRPSSLITMFVLDATELVPAGTNGLLRFHAGTSIKGTDIIWRGDVYQNLPCSASGFDMNSQGPSARPRIQFENVRQLFTDLTLLYQDLVGAKIIRKRTFYSRLDAVNYADGINPTADPEAQIPDDVYSIIRKSAENKNIVEFELGSPLDLDNVMLPGRTIQANICRFRYRGGECGEAEDYVFAQDDDTPIPNNKINGLHYRGQYDATLDYLTGDIVWVSASAPYIKIFYYAGGTPTTGEDVTTSANWVVDQRFTGVYSPTRVYGIKDTCYKMLGFSGIREYYYNLVPCINVEPPVQGFWLTDRCSFLVSGCKLRFSADERGLPFGGFPGTALTPLATA